MCVAAALLLAAGAGAQDFPDLQRLTDKVLFAKQDVAARERDAERRRVDALAQRSEAQAALLETQAASVRQLSGELQQIRDERALVDATAAFDAAVAAGRFGLVRPLLAETVTFDLPGQAGTAVPADAFVAALPTLAPRGAVLPRAGQRVRVEGERAALLSDGYGWRPPGRAAAGQYEYGFRRTPDGWRLDTLLFRPTQP